MRSGETTVVVNTHGRHDPCVGIRATPIAEAMVALVLAFVLLSGWNETLTAAVGAPTNPLGVVEDIATDNNWAFERSGEDDGEERVFQRAAAGRAAACGVNRRMSRASATGRPLIIATTRRTFEAAFASHTAIFHSAERRRDAHRGVRVALRPRGDRAAHPEDDQVRRGSGARNVGPQVRPEHRHRTARGDHLRG